MDIFFSSSVYQPLLRSWTRSLRARNRSPRTIESYLLAAEQLAAFARFHHYPELGRKLIEEFLGDMAGRSKPATVAQRYRSLQQLCKWLVEEGEIDSDPMAKMRAPHVPEVPVPVLSTEQIKDLLKTCDGRSFTDRRDSAILRLLLDTGMRRGELVGLRTDDLDMDLDVVYVLGKGRKPRSCPIGPKTGQAIDRYLRVRAQHPHASRQELWLGDKGSLTPSGVTYIIRRRGRQAGIPGLHPHQFRHTFAHRWMSSGGNETDLMRLAGWSSQQMLLRYGRSAADQRAQEAHRRLNPGEQF